MTISTIEGIVENGQIRLLEGVRHFPRRRECSSLYLR